MFRRAFLTGLVAMAGASAARADEQVYFEGPKTVELPLKYSQVDGKLYLVGQVNGRDLTFFIDTGATSIIDINLAKDLGLEQV
ncbi:MAG: aspartyl protease family protein, partial [Asticcacaulis sp.]|nr:aspartyl protease family protein [Asticcacaulis sp.]